MAALRTLVFWDWRRDHVTNVEGLLSTHSGH